MLLLLYPKLSTLIVLVQWRHERLLTPLLHVLKIDRVHGYWFCKRLLVLIETVPFTRVNVTALGSNNKSSAWWFDSVKHVTLKTNTHTNSTCILNVCLLKLCRSCHFPIYNFEEYKENCPTLQSTLNMGSSNLNIRWIFRYSSGTTI